MADEFSERYEGFLECTYDCVDRIVLNAYFPLIQSGGGFRTWWRRLRGGDDDLDNAHLIRFAGRFSRRVRAHAKKRGIPLIDCDGDERKHEIAEGYLPTDPEFRGVFCILVGRAPAPVREVHRYGKGGIDIRKKKRYPYVNQYAFHILDPQWGHLMIKLCPHPPFSAQIILNGHEYVAREAKGKGIAFTKEGNCFTEIFNPEGLTRIADTLSARRSIGRLVKVCESWIYSTCLCFALSLDEQQRSGFFYAYSVYQGEYSRNLLFTRGRELEQVFQSVIDRTRSHLDIRTVKTIFGYLRRPFKHGKNKKKPRFEVVLERPAWNLTVFKVHFGKLTVKIYSKGERVLRIEAIAHNAVELRCGKSIAKFQLIVAALKAMLERFLLVLRSVDAAFIDDGTLEKLRHPSIVGATRLGGIDINNARMRAVMAAVIALSANPKGFPLAELAEKVCEIMGCDSELYRCRQAAYDLKKLRAKGFVDKLRGTRRYNGTPKGLQAMVALHVLREKVIKPLLAGDCKRRKGRKSKNRSIIDEHYESIQIQMQQLFDAVGIAV